MKLPLELLYDLQKVRNKSRMTLEKQVWVFVERILTCVVALLILFMHCHITRDLSLKRSRVRAIRFIKIDQFCCKLNCSTSFVFLAFFWDLFVGQCRLASLVTTLYLLHFIQYWCYINWLETFARKCKMSNVYFCPKF